jgi:hypothetical protein
MSAPNRIRSYHTGILALAAVAGLAVLGEQDASAQSCATVATEATLELTGPEQSKDVTSGATYGSTGCSSYAVLVKGTAGPQIELQAIFAGEKPATKIACEEISVIGSFYAPKQVGIGWEMVGTEKTVRGRWGTAGCSMNAVFYDQGAVTYRSMRVAARALVGDKPAKVKVWAGNRTPPQ